MSQVFLAIGKSKTLVANGTITAGTVAAPISLTSTAHGLETGDMVFITGVVGLTAANGKWIVTKVDANNYTLQNSVGNAAWSAGGTVVHLGWSATAVFDNTVFPLGMTRTSFRTRIDSLDQGATLRTVWEDTADAAFTTAQPFWSVDKPGRIAPGYGEASFLEVNEMWPSLRAASAGNSIRVSHYLIGGVGKNCIITDSFMY